MIQQRVTPSPDLEMATNLRHEPVHFHRIPSPRAQIVEGDAHLPGRRDRVAMRAQQVGERAQHAQHFPQLGGLRGAQLVAQLDALGGLDEHGAAGRRLVVHDAADPRARGRANRNDVAAAAHRHRGIGRALGLIERSQDRAELVHHMFACLADALAGTRQIFRRAVEDLTVWGDRLDELGFEFLGGWVDTEVRGARCAVAEALEICCDHAHRGEGHGELGERRPLERAAFDPEQVERGRDIGNRLGANRFSRAAMRAAPRGPAACCATRARAWGNSSVAKTWSMPPAPRVRSDSRVCRPRVP